jgi:hypothetical protein
VFWAKAQFDPIAVCARFIDWVLADDAAIVFHFNLEIIVWENLRAEI